MATEDFNKKLPKGLWGNENETGRITPQYPYVHVNADVCGKVTAVYANPEQPDKCSEMHFNHDGTFYTKEMNDEFKGVETALKHLELNYNSGGKSQQTDGHSDENVESTKRIEVSGDSAHVTGKNKIDAAAGKKMGGSGGGVFENHSEGNIYTTTKGDVVTEHTGGYFHSIEGNDVRGVKGTKYDMVSGQYGIHVQQGGNFDVRVEDGKFQLYSGDSFIANTAGTFDIKSTGALTINSSSTGSIKTSQSLILESSQTLTLKVGSSTIVMSAGSITITSGAINFVQG